MGEHPPLTREQFVEFCDHLHDEGRADLAVGLFDEFDGHDTIRVSAITDYLEADDFDPIPEPPEAA